MQHTDRTNIAVEVLEYMNYISPPSLIGFCVTWKISALTYRSVFSKCQILGVLYAFRLKVDIIIIITVKTFACSTSLRNRRTADRSSQRFRKPHTSVHNKSGQRETAVAYILPYHVFFKTCGDTDTYHEYPNLYWLFIRWLYIILDNHTPKEVQRN
jgi:hypothetical protein